MPQTRPNGVKVPVNADAYNLTADLATQADTSNVVIPVANLTARDALTKVAGLTVTRLDIIGQPIEVCDGTNWSRMGTKLIPSAASLVGAAQAATAFTTGGFVPLIQGGTAVVTTDASGYFSINYPLAYPNGVLGVIFSNGDSAAGGRDLIVSVAGSPFTQSVSTGYGGAVDKTGAAKASATIRINWISLGW